jgi:hypothetical protein
MTTINDTLMEETLAEVNRLKEIIKEMDENIEKINEEINFLKEKYKIQKDDLRNRIIDQLNDVEHKRRIVLDHISELKKKTLPKGYIEVTAYGFFGERAITDDFAIKPESEESIRQEEYRGLDLEFTKKYPDVYIWKKLYWIPMSEIEKEIIRSKKSEEK